jgi:hypothetical protein
VKRIKGRGNGRGLKVVINCLNLLARAEGKRKGDDRARRGLRRRATRAEQRKEGEEGRGKGG